MVILPLWLAFFVGDLAGALWVTLELRLCGMPGSTWIADY